MSRSAPASAWTRAIAPSRSSVAGASAPSAPKSTHWPCAVYAHTQTSVATARSGTASFTAWIARGTTWSRSLASIAVSSFRSETPKRRNPAIPADAAARASRTSSVIAKRSSHVASGTRSRSSSALDTTPGRMVRPWRAAEPRAGAQAPDAAVTAPVAIQTVEPKAAPASAALDMRHLWQSLNNCGPASVVMALSTFGITADQETARLALRGPDVRRGMGPQGVDPWVKELYGLRSMWRNNGTNGLLKQLVANGFAPLVTQWMQDPSVSRIAHWRAIRGYDDALGTFYVNDPMLGNFVPLSYRWIQDNWQPFSYRYMVIYRPEDEALLKAIVGPEWSESRNREAFYQRTKAEALAQDTAAA